MSNPVTKGKGKAITWMRAHLDYQGEGCLPWPFSRDPHVGRGRVGFNGKMYWANRLMCILAHGEPPTPGHETAHSCGKGHEGCVHPQHLSWKTKSGNQLDRRKHGTHVTSRHGWRGKLTPREVIEIRSLKGYQTQVEIAKMFNISDTNVRAIHSGRTWKSVRC